jgi:hypothetical protein
MATQRLGLRVQHPAVGVCVVVVVGELDLLTAPLLDACVREQLAAAPTNLILDLQAVRFLGASGLSCLLRAREGVLQTTGCDYTSLAWSPGPWRARWRSPGCWSSSILTPA